ncbi:hypothetical protein Pla52nx_005654 [Stieleria varia]|uniref:hypothetical protein n=1 Tax=Stieleria varia TaxID=2528005 RepID=UPI00313CCD56
MRYNPMVASERYSAAEEDDRTMRWTEATHRADEHGNHNGVARSTPPFAGEVSLVMTIRHLLATTAMIAIGMALFAWNSGVAVFVLATVPMTVVLLSNSPKGFCRRWLRRFSIVVATTLLYFASVGPYVGTVRVFLAFDEHPAWLTELTDTLYFPHQYLSDHPITGSYFGPINLRYNIAWSVVGIGIRDIVSGTTTEFPAWFPR